MGKIILYGAGRSAQALLSMNYLTSTDTTTVKRFKDVNGTTYDYLWFTTGKANLTMDNITIFNALTGYVSSDTESDFDIEDYTTNEIADITYSRTVSNTTTNKIYTITATNNGASAVTVGSIKFVKTFKTSVNGSQKTPNCLTLGYFLDTPVTLGVGEAKTFAVNIDYWNY